MIDRREKIDEIFWGALQIVSSEQRGAYLDQKCGEDSDLRALIEKLLLAQPKVEQFLEKPFEVNSPTINQPPAEQAGAQIGPYKLLQQIGEGGMGTVFMAEQTEPVQRKVALKLIKPGMDSRQVIARFEAERQALALMDHPHIAKVLDAGTTGSGLPYFVMELVKGVPITKYCDEHHLTPRERLELFIPVCQAVQHAHQKGIIHRDLKPSNVLVALYDGRPVPKVIDFGVAKATGQKLTERTMYTEFGAIVGTLEYMSPEQAESNQLDIDTRSDIYSLGVLLYELLTGTTPFEKKRLKDAALMEILRIIREDEPQRPSTRLSTTDELPSIAANRGLEPNKLSGLVRGDLDWIVMKALEKDRNRRYETASGFAVDIQRYLADEPVSACPPSIAYRLRKFARRNRGTLTVSAVVVLAVFAVAGSVGWMVRDRTAREEEFVHKQKAREQEIADEKKEREAALDRTVDLALLEADQFRAQEKWPEALDALERADKLLASADRSDRPPHLVALQKDLAMALRLEDIYHNRQRDPTITVLTLGLDATPGGLSPAERAAEDEIFAGREQDNRFAAAFREFGIDVDALEIAEAAARIGRTTIGPALIKAFDDWSAVRRRARGEGDAGWQKLVEIARQSDRDDWRNKFRGAFLARDREALEKLADEVSRRDIPPATLFLLADTIKALGDPEKAINLLVRAHGQYPDDLWINDALAWFSWNSRPPRYGDAVRFYTAVLALRPRSSRWHKALGDVLLATNATEEGIAELSRALELQPDDWSVLYSRGQHYANLGEMDKAFADFDRAIELQPDNWDIPYVRSQWYARLSQWDKALADCDRIIELKPGNALSWGLRALYYERLERWDEALSDLSKAIEVEPASIHSWSGRARFNEARLHWDGAIADYSRLIELKPDDAGAWRNRGRCFRFRGDAQRAQADFSEALRLNSKAIELKPDDASLWSGRANVYAELGDSGNELSDRSKAIELQPDNSHLWNDRGRYFTWRKRWAEAVPDFSKAIELEPDNSGLLSDRAECFVNLKQWDKAASDFSKMIELQPDDTSCRNNRANCYREMRQRDKAIADYSKVLEIDRPRFGSWQHRKAWFQRRELQLEQGQWDQAVAAFAEPLRRQLETSEQWENRARMFMDLTLWPEAAAAYEKVFELGESTDIRTFALHALLRRFLQDGPGYRDACRRMLARFGESDNLLVCGQFALVLGTDPEPGVEPSRIVAYAERALANDGAFGRTEMEKAANLGLAYYRAGEFERAKGALEKPIPEYLNLTGHLNRPHNLYSTLAMVEHRLANPDQAAAALAKASSSRERWFKDMLAVKLADRGFSYWFENFSQWEVLYQEAYELIHGSPPLEDALSLVVRGRALEAIGRADEAQAAFARAFAMQPEDLSIRIYAMPHVSRTEAFIHALEELGTFLKEHPNQPDAARLALAQAHNNLAWILATSSEIARRDPQRAVALATKAVELSPTEGSLWNTLGAAHYRTGDWTAAGNALNKSMELRNGGDAFDWFFLAMAECQQGNKDEARRWHDKAAEWRAEKARDNEELQRFEAETKDVLGIKDK
jgi:tetratricopeptide (TPR) repeat protein/serine/threonine protein kinase